MTRTQAVCLAGLATLVLGGVYFTRTGHAPAGQSPYLLQTRLFLRPVKRAPFKGRSLFRSLLRAISMYPVANQAKPILKIARSRLERVGVDSERSA
jgi:hypothetical protein